MSKNNKEFQEFLRDEVNINQSRLDRLHTSVGAVSGYLKDNMKRYQKSEPQGSLALETIIRPVDDNGRIRRRHPDRNESELGLAAQGLHKGSVRHTQGE